MKAFQSLAAADAKPSPPPPLKPAANLHLTIPRAGLGREYLMSMSLIPQSGAATSRGLSGKVVQFELFHDAVDLYEATEGGAGVLTRLVHEPDAVARIAHAGLKAMHFDMPEFGQPLPQPADLKDIEAAECVAGCYRCLLSYFNQTDHLIIDRKDVGAVAVLVRLAASRTRLEPLSFTKRCCGTIRTNQPPW